MDIGDAVAALKHGKRVARAGWNGRGMWIRIVAALDEDPLGCPYPRRAYIQMKDAHGFTVPWSASQADLLAEDWEIVP